MSKRAKLVVLTIAAAITYNDWLLSPFLNRHLWSKDGSLSEYSIASQPYHLVFRLIDVLSGILLIYIGFRIYKLIQQYKTGRLFGLSVILLGVANILDACFVLPCSETLSNSCSVPISLSLHHFRMPAHAYSSSLIGLCYFILPMLALIFAYRKRLSRLVGFSLLVVLESLYSLGSLLVMYNRAGGPTTKASGSGQVIEMLLLGIWLVFCVYELAVERPRALD